MATRSPFQEAKKRRWPSNLRQIGIDAVYGESGIACGDPEGGLSLVDSCGFFCLE